SISRMALDIVANNLICDDETKPINYRPTDGNGDVEDGNGDVEDGNGDVETET
ncbi:hypothetical protein BGX29_003322, partial [Mortierella sp. GBA35]